MTRGIHPIVWNSEEKNLLLLDQRLLPLEDRWLHLKTYEETAAAIRDMAVRGAPAIGVTAAFGVVLGMRAWSDSGETDLAAHFEKVYQKLAQSRPTARNLFSALEQMRRVFEKNKTRPLDALLETLTQKALAVSARDEMMCRSIGKFGASLIEPGQGVLTHCNAGALATAGYGTALGIVRSAVEAGKDFMVYADETRPYLQGARLTAWELKKDKIPVTVIPDNTAGWLMKKGKIQCVVVGADRIAQNGDTANKIGTYSLAVLAEANGVPFYVAAPTTTVDRAIANGEGIPIEERSGEEVTHIGAIRIAPEATSALYYAFDVTPARYITAIVTEKGIARPPYDFSED